MRKIAFLILRYAIVSLTVYLAIAAVLIVTGKPDGQAPGRKGLVFNELFMSYSGIPDLKTFTARDGTPLSYRRYTAKSENVLILLHGTAWHSRYFFRLAKFISSEGLAEVYTPDLRGHGAAPQRRGDVDYIGQLDDDLADLIDLIKKSHPRARIIVGGHSSGGGLALRFAGSRYKDRINAWLLLSPYLQYNAPTIRPQSGGWVSPWTRRIVGLAMLNRLGITRFNYLTVVDFNMPESARDGTETLSYSYRLLTSYGPEDYRKDLRVIKKPLLVLVGTNDEAFYADRFKEAISKDDSGAEVVLLPGVTHLGIVVNPETLSSIRKWMENFGRVR